MLLASLTHIFARKKNTIFRQCQVIAQSRTYLESRKFSDRQRSWSPTRGAHETNARRGSWRICWRVRYSSTRGTRPCGHRVRWERSLRRWFKPEPHTHTHTRPTWPSALFMARINQIYRDCKNSALRKIIKKSTHTRLWLLLGTKRCFPSPRSRRGYIKSNPTHTKSRRVCINSFCVVDTHYTFRRLCECCLFSVCVSVFPDPSTPRRTHTQ